MLRVLAAALMLGLSACAASYRTDTAPMATVPSVDLARYSGRWYEVARFPVWFQEGCVAVTADYALRADGKVDVTNTCRKGDFEGPIVVATGVARSVDATNARLKVRFSDLVPFEGDYWIIYIDEDYRTAVVGVPSGWAGWILSRTPHIAPEDLEAAQSALAANGYDLTRLVATPQPD